MTALVALVARLLLALRKFLSRIFRKDILTLWLQKILKRLAYTRSILLSRTFLQRKGNGGSSEGLESSTDKIAKSKEEHDIHELEAARRSALRNEFAPGSYTIIQNGDTISLEGIMSSSLYPFSNGNIRNTSRSSLRSDHNLSTHSRSPSRSSLRPESLYSRHSTANSINGFQLRPPSTGSHDHSASHSQCSASVLESQHVIVRRDSSPSICILVTAPDNTSQRNLQIPSNPYPYLYPQSQSATQCRTQSDAQSENEFAQNISIDNHDRPRLNCISDISSDVDITEGPHITVSIPSDQQSLFERYIRPVFPAETQRYRRRTKIYKRETNMTFQPITLDYSKPAPPAGWIRYAHPEGACYFYNKKKRVYTDSEIYDPKILSHLEADMEYISMLSNTFDNPFPDTGEFVINAYHTSDGMESEYYCIDHHTRLIFFLKVFHANWMEAWNEAPGVTSPAQLQIELEAQYWFFVQLFPTSSTLSNDTVSELRDIVLHLIGDCMTSPYSTACYTLDNLYKILTLTGELDKNVGSNSAQGAMCLLARKMYIFTHSRFLNFHGESCARIERDFSVYGDKLDRRTWFIKAFSFVLFSVPDAHLVNLQKMWVDGLMHKSVWENTMRRMNDEWQEFVFFATVLLNANIAFLAIKSVDTGTFGHRSPAQISAYASVLANIASIVLGLLLMRQNRIKSRETADDVQRFLSARNHPLLGLESLAILYSLPYALLMWGLVSFLAAFAFMCFERSNASTRSIIGALGCAVAILCVWCISVFWETKAKTDDDERSFAYSAPVDSNHESEENGDGNVNAQSDMAHDAEEKSSTKKLTALGRLWRFSTMFRHRRASCDSGNTVVEATMIDV